MIQRVQTIFLVLGAAMLGLLFLKPLSLLGIDEVPEEVAAGSMLVDGNFTIDDNPILLALIGVVILLLIIAVFLFKNRSLQIKIGQVSLFAVCIATLLSIFFFWKEYQVIADGSQILPRLGYALIILASLFILLAIRSIRKDEKLVRSADRLR